jgi:hypothetical protein
MDWWKLFAPRWLNSRSYNAMPYQARGPYDCICFQLCCEEEHYGIMKYSDEALADFAKLTDEEWKLERLHILKGFWLYPDGTLHQRTIKAMYEQRCKEAHESYVNGEKGVYIKRLNKLPPKSKTKISEPKILPYLSPYAKWDSKMEGKRADLAVKQGGLEGGLWGANSGGLDSATRGANHPLYIREEERRVDKTLLSNHATPTAAGGAGGDVAIAEPASDLRAMYRESIKAKPENQP